MTLSNEPDIYIHDEFGIGIEDCFVVTEEGGKYLGVYYAIPWKILSGNNRRELI